MTKEQLISIFPDLKDIIRSDKGLRARVDFMLSNSLQGSMKRYLNNAPVRALVTFLNELEGIDPARISAHRSALKDKNPLNLDLDDVAPIKMFTLDEQKERKDSDASVGKKAIEEGKIASVAFAGGSGTRFFSNLPSLESALEHPNEQLQQGGFSSDEPKGAFPISPVAGLSFYEIIMAQALAVGIETKRLPWVMFLTSRVTHEKTLSFFRNKTLWGFPKNEFIALQQAQEPRLDEKGDLVVADTEGHLAWTGDGHGGVYRALLTADANGNSVMSRLREDGVENLVMHNVDNAAARPFDFSRLGFHITKKSLFTLSSARKTDPKEKVGVLMRLLATGRTEVVEYNVIDTKLAQARTPGTARLLHEAGNINTNIVSLEAIRADIAPTLYRAKIVSSTIGQLASSSFEMLNQHLTRLLPADRVFAFEVSRNEFFMPTKNVTGVDSVVSTQKMMSQRFARMLGKVGAEVNAHAVCDLHPCCSCGHVQMEHLGLGPGWHLEDASRVYICAASSTDENAPVCDGKLTLEPGACLIVDSALPWGEVSMDSNRRIQINKKAASRIMIESGMKIRAGIKVKISLAPGAQLRIGKNKEFTKDTTLVLGHRHALEI